MNLSKRWLHDYVNLDVTDKDFAAALTLSGSKVEGYETEGEELSNIVVAKIEKLILPQEISQLSLSFISIVSSPSGRTLTV